MTVKERSPQTVKERSEKLCGWIGMGEMMLAGEGQKWFFTLCAGKLQSSSLYVSKDLRALKGRLCKLAEERF